MAYSRQYERAHAGSQLRRLNTELQCTKDSHLSLSRWPEYVRSIPSRERTAITQIGLAQILMILGAKLQNELLNDCMMGHSLIDKMRDHSLTNGSQLDELLDNSVHH
eukprot:scaffold114488_cov24-Prasinocladus_malaysianus.AAC.1